MASGAEPGVLELVRRGHEERILALLRARGPLSRAEIARSSGLSRSTLSEIVSALLERGAVVTATAEATGRRSPGRPAELVTLNPAAGRTLGMDFGHRRVHVAVADAAQQVAATGTRSYARSTSWGRRVRIACNLVDSLRVDLGPLTGVGVGVAGPVPRDRDGRPDGAARQVAEAVGEHFGVPVVADNNTRLAALAEAARGAGTGSSDVVYVRLSDGVGGGIVADGRLLRGAAGTAGEIGHVPVDAAGPPCGCGGHGCLEAYASVPAVLAACGGADLPGALAALDAGDAAARAAFDRAGRALGLVLAGVCNTLAPERVVVGGELAAAGEAILGPAEEALRRHALPMVRADLRLSPASLGPEAGALGAIALVAHESPLLAGYPFLMAGGTPA
ncbi:ROK family transcriptional regulator [Actinomadura citrea]|uniref:Putative NBD/HSP70 family sugar kinase/biotin operon repressor n=1 Tax=Actinomadura citrea TaxID=46158 RepID=A0A7Y9KHZ9_9ACTN|nr:ROK family transcriptional regulator [Actinomadura citrea]NYE16284.1 putative NBD/HSP70 family sugar kinase/biotin operon repressor [Actinomadura citrea]GGT96067.1 transcriptional regulator [Actinomadura citrea]